MFCEPLHFIVDKMFPVLEQRLLDLQEGHRRLLSAGPKRRDAAQEQADLILAKMREVLDHMMKTEDFNINVVQRLKKIIERPARTDPTDQENRTRKPWRIGVTNMVNDFGWVCGAAWTAPGRRR